ncbi:hypothetical protein JX266_009407 [Neoarthrinium moseri]|nr:hypothetical protein JX266_009407 [Neoarthrinium moseri]
MAMASEMLVVAQTSSLNVTAFVESMPECAFPCIFDTLLEGNCSLTDDSRQADCLCTNIPLQSKFSTCVQLNCEAILDQSSAFKHESNMCEAFPKESRTDVAIISGIITIALSIPIVFARCATRLKVTKRLWADDYMSLITLAMLLAMSSMQIFSARKGIGRHYWDLNLADIVIIRQLFYASKIFYVIIQCTGKVAILLLYQRVFNTGTGAPWFMRTIKILILLTFLVEGVYVLIISFQCWPVAALWDPSIHGAKCFNATAAFSAGGVLNIVSDVVLMFLPIPALRKLQVSRKKRLGIVLMLAVASLGIVASLVRIRFIVAGASAFDSTYFNVDVFTWSLIELFGYLAIDNCFLSLIHCTTLEKKFEGSSTAKHSIDQSIQRRSVREWKEIVVFFGAPPNETFHWPMERKPRLTLETK